jgi:hypothetical protein
VRSSKRHAGLPIGRTARIAYEIDAMRAACSKAAEAALAKDPADRPELDECIRLDDGLALAHRILKAAVRDVMLLRLNRRSRAK